MKSWLGGRVERVHGRSWPALIAAATIAASASVVAGTPAYASTSAIPGSVAIDGNNFAGSTSTSYSVSFTTSGSGSLGTNSTITFVAPNGTTFPASGACSSGCYSVSASSGSATISKASTSSVNGSSTPNAVTMTLTTSLLITSISGSITVTIDSVGNPTVASNSYTIGESTSADTNQVQTSTYQVNPGAPATMTVAPGSSPQSGTVTQAYPNPLEVHLVDAYNNAVPGQSVTFTAPPSGATVTFGSPPSSETVVSTDSQGNAITPVPTASQVAGSFTVTATSSGPTADLNLQNISGPATSLIVVSGNSQSVLAASSFSLPLKVQAADQYGNAVVGKPVTFTAPSSGPSATFGSCQAGNPGASVCIVDTDGSGDATSSAVTANAVAGGPYTVAASIGGVATNFQLTNLTGPPARIAAVSGSNQSALVSGPFNSLLQVRVSDREGNAVPGVVVTFSAPSSGVTATFAPCSRGNPSPNECLAVTDQYGYATSSALTAGGSPGVFNVAVLVPGASSAIFTLTAVGSGYRTVASDGGIFTFGGAPFYGSTGAIHLNAPIVGMANANGGGYYLVASDGGIFSFGPGATFYGSTGAQHLNAPVVGMAVDPQTGGYWLVASDGGVFSFNAPFWGSMGAQRLNAPIIGIAATPEGGYYLVASDGGIFSFGPGANFYGSAGGQPLNAPIVSMATAPDGGYWLVASDGGIFTFGPGAVFFGSAGDQHLNRPIVAMSVDPATGGYWLVASDGGIFSFGAPFYGSTGGMRLNAPIVGIAPSA